MSIPIHNAGPAHIVSHHRTATRGQELRREGSGRSAGSEGTLVNGAWSGRTSPEVTVPASAFQSPQLGYTARPLAEVERPEVDITELNRDLEGAAKRFDSAV